MEWFGKAAIHRHSQYVDFWEMSGTGKEDDRVDAIIYDDISATHLYLRKHIFSSIFIYNQDLAMRSKYHRYP